GFDVAGVFFGNRADQAAPDFGGADFAAAKMRGENRAIKEYRDRFGSAEHRARRLDLDLAVDSAATAQFLEDRHQHLDQIGRQLRFQLIIGHQVAGALFDDGGLRGQIFRHGQFDKVEAAFERAGHIVDAAVTRVGGGDDAEAAP